MLSLRTLIVATLLTPLAACHAGGEGAGPKATLPPAGEAPKPQPATGEAAAQPSATAGAAVDAAPGAPSDAQPTVAAQPNPSAAATVEYRLTGEVTSVRKSQLAFRVSGYIQSATARPGNALKKGDVLATLDERDFVLRLELARAKRDSAKVATEDAEKEFKREQELKNANASTATSYDKIKANYDQAKIALKLAELDVQNAEYALKDTKLVAPYDCVVSAQLHYDGEAVQSTPVTPVYEVYDTSEPEVTLSAPERLMSKVKVGGKLDVAIPSAGVQSTAQVTRIVPVISDRTRTFQVTAKLAAHDKIVVAGAYAEATLD
jgi:RND family efflux transporter MFP subunit